MMISCVVGDKKCCENQKYKAYFLVGESEESENTVIPCKPFCWYIHMEFISPLTEREQTIQLESEHWE